MEQNLTCDANSPRVLQNAKVGYLVDDGRETDALLLTELFNFFTPFRDGLSFCVQDGREVTAHPHNTHPESF